MGDDEITQYYIRLSQHHAGRVIELKARLAALTAALREIKPLVTGQLPMPIKPEMMGRCMRIADIIDAAIYDETAEAAGDL